eukprot:822299-Prorocentrum_minimum.AAC.1
MLEPVSAGANASSTLDCDLSGKHYIDHQLAAPHNNHPRRARHGHTASVKNCGTWDARVPRPQSEGDQIPTGFWSHEPVLSIEGFA